MDDNASFGYWVRRRRKILDLTQGELAQQVGCAESMIRKVEADERRPSKQLAELLADQLAISASDRTAFLQCARGNIPVDQLSALTAVEEKSVTLEPITTSITTSEDRDPLHNVPSQLTSFVGREREMATIRHRLASTRLLTLTGPGGTGKTRLALHLASDVLDAFPDGVWLVELAPLGEPALVPQALATVLSVREEAGRPLLTTLTNYLRHKHLLLLLDNCEHLIDACAQLTEALLRACPNVRMLATSREPLSIGGETVFRVPPLAVPEARQLPPLDQLVETEAVRLFTERARSVQPDFQVTNDTMGAVVQICQRLDGIPLAIELAAARVRMLTVQQIAARLDDRFRLLTDGSRTALPRHQTLQALIDWSYNLLSEEEQMLLRRLAVFAGGWTLEAAEAICVGGVVTDVLELLTRLVDKSLVLVTEVDGAARYRRLETIRQYTLEKLAASGEIDELRRQHALYYLALAEAATTDQQGWNKQVVIENNNLRAALQWSFEQTDVELAARLAAALGWFWFRHGYWREAQAWLQQAIAQLGTEEHMSTRAQILFIQGLIAQYQGDTKTGQTLMEKSAALYWQLGDKSRSFSPFLNRGILAREQGDAVQAIEWIEKALAIGRDVGRIDSVAWALTSLGEVAVLQEDVTQAISLLMEGLTKFRESELTVGMGWALNHLAHVAHLQGDYERATVLYEESLSLFRETDRQGVAWGLEGLGEAALAQGDGAGATIHFVESLQIFQDLGDTAVTWSLAGLGSAAAMAGQPKRAARLWGAAEALRIISGRRTAPVARATYERVLIVARDQLGETAFAAAWAEGQVMTLEQAVMYALEEG